MPRILAQMTPYIYSPNSTTTSNITSMHHPESIHNVQRCSSIRRNFHCSPILATTYLTPSHPVQIDIHSLCQKLCLKVHPSSILGNKFNVLPHTLTWSTKCYTTPWNQEGTNAFLTLKCGMTPFSNSNRILTSISIIQRTHIKRKMNNLKIQPTLNINDLLLQRNILSSHICQNHF